MPFDPRNNPDTAAAYARAMETTETESEPTIVFRSPKEWAALELPAGYQLVGDNHLCRGDVAFLAGVPGCGKSRAALAAAVAGATGQDWMGLKTHCRFKTLVVQSENGPVRLRDECRDIVEAADTGDDIMICEPPQCGLAFADDGFKAEVRARIKDHGTGLLVIDPWNAVSFNDRLEDYRSALAAVTQCLPEDPAIRPAVLISHHLRKSPSIAQRKRGRELLAEMAGSYVIGSAARTVFVMEPATSDPEDDRIVFTVAKSNNGSMPPPTAWHRKNGLFDQCSDFDWEEWRTGPEKASERRTITEDTVRSVIRGDALTPQEFVERMEKEQGFKKSAAHEALKRHAQLLDRPGGLIALKSRDNR